MKLYKALRLERLVINGWRLFVPAFAAASVNALYFRKHTVIPCQGDGPLLLVWIDASPMRLDIFKLSAGDFMYNVR